MTVEVGVVLLFGLNGLKSKYLLKKSELFR